MRAQFSSAEDSGVEGTIPRVSVVVPNFNHARFLDLRMKTVLQQTFTDFEVLFLDDASTDNSLEVAEKYLTDARVRLLTNQQNSGSPFVQWNKGIGMSRGEYIWIAESDDYSDLTFLEKMVELLDSTPTAGLAYSQSWLAAEDDTPIKVVDWYKQYWDAGRWENDYHNFGQDEVASYLSVTNTIPNASAVLLRKAHILDKELAPESMRLAGDWMAWVKILLRADVCFRAEPLNYFRDVHLGSQRGRSDSDGGMVLEALQVYRFIKSNFELSQKQRIRAMYRHLRTWGRIASRDKLSRTVNDEFFADFQNISRLGTQVSRIEILLPYVFYYLLIPFRKTWAYDCTFGVVRKVMDSVR